MVFCRTCGARLQPDTTCTDCQEEKDRISSAFRKEDILPLGSPGQLASSVHDEDDQSNEKKKKWQLSTEDIDRVARHLEASLVLV